MTDPHSTQPTGASGRGGRLPMRAAALGLLALAALIAAVMIFRGGDSESNAAGESSSAAASTTQSGTVTSGASTAPPVETSEGSASTTAQQAPTTAAPTDATAGQTEALPPAGVTVLVTSQTWNASTSSIEVVGSVQGVATQSSTCTAKATSGQTVVEATVEGTFDGQGTSCGLISIPMSGQPAGAYEVVISFDAGNGVAKSDPVLVTVP